MDTTMLSLSHEWKPQSAKQWLSCFVSVSFIIASILASISALRLQPSEVQCVQRGFSWSPVSDQISYHWETFDDIDFFTYTPYFGVTPSDEIENAWNSLLPSHPIAIPNSRLHDLNQSTAPTSPSWIYPPNDEHSVLALPEVFVQLGCLNFLRQMSLRKHRDYSHLASFQGGEELVWRRAHQCLERFRQAVMCWSDTGVLLKAFDPDPPKGHEHRLVFDMGTYHNCRDFERVAEWTGRNGIQSVTMDNLWWGGSRDV